MKPVHILTPLLLAASLAAGATFARASDQKANPSLRASSLKPLVLRGARFRPLERVRLTLTAQGESTRRMVRATRRGVFTASFPDVVVDRCNEPFGAVAVGRLGSRAALKLPQLLCPPRIP